VRITKGLLFKGAQYEERRMWHFISQFFKSPLQTGAVLPSSPLLAKAMAKSINFKKAKVIVELGPGTGVITKELLARMQKDARLIAVEINRKFCKGLKAIKDPRLKVVKGDARSLSRIVRQADVVVSGLPLVSFGEKDHHKVLGEIKKIAKHYVQFHYSPLGEAQLKQHFPKFKRAFVVANVPPAIVYSAKR